MRISIHIRRKGERWLCQFVRNRENLEKREKKRRKDWSISLCKYISRSSECYEISKSRWQTTKDGEKKVKNKRHKVKLEKDGWEKWWRMKIRGRRISEWSGTVKNWETIIKRITKIIWISMETVSLWPEKRQ